MGPVVSSGIRRQVKQSIEEKPVFLSSICFSSFLDIPSGWAVSCKMNKPFPPHVASDQCFIPAIQGKLRHSSFLLRDLESFSFLVLAGPSDSASLKPMWLPGLRDIPMPSQMSSGEAGQG